MIQENRFASRLGCMKHPNLHLIGIATIILFIKGISFHSLTFGTFPVCESGMELTNLKFYVAKLLFPLMLSSLLFFTSKKWWLTLSMILIDIYCLANIIYFKSYDLFLTPDALSLVGNMDGAWTSVEAYLDLRLLVFPLSTIFWLVLSYPILTNSKNLRFGCVFLVTLFIIGYGNNILVYDYTDACGVTKFSNRSKDESFTFKKYCRLPFMGIAMHRMDNRGYVYEQSILSYIPASIIAFLRDINTRVEMSSNDVYLLNKLTTMKSWKQTSILPPPSIMPQTNLIIILVESLESWVINQYVDSVEITPFLNKLVSQKHVLYCDKIKSQTLAGNSGDGQMIINTGLLPLQKGVACMQYYSNIYPNIAGFYSCSSTINPWPHIWNQTAMSKRYGYQQLLEPIQTEEWQDRDILNQCVQFIEKANSNFCVMGITISMHSPFTRVMNPLDISNQTPELLRKYMECVNYTDRCIQKFIEEQLSDTVKYNTTIVITSDHTIFKPAVLKDFEEYSKEYELSFANGENYCPLIIFSPQIKDNVKVNDVCYQMDVYPTIMHLIDCDEYYWKGFGVNVLDSMARHNRPVTEKEAYELSDKLIRSNYFNSFVH
jgi:phosphoglycerol transferase MdoB-like AlkP superfamily enzyme